MGSLDEALAAVERACVEFQHPATHTAAEAVLLSFRRSPGVMPAARHILETSSSTDARFHAACALREAMLREWASHAPEERSGLRSYLLSYVLAHAGAPSLGVVNAAIAGALAVSLKRGWMEAPDSRGSLFQELEAASAAAGSALAAAAALQVLEAVVSEFSLSTASPLGLSWEFHEACRDSLEEDYLRHIFEHALQSARRGISDATHAPPGSEAAVQSVALATAAIRVMLAALSWDFRAHQQGTSSAFQSGAAALQGVAMGRRGLPDGYAVRPGATWGDVLLSEACTDWLTALQQVAAARLPPDGTGALELLPTARQLVVALCSLTGDVFPRAAPPPARASGSAPPQPQPAPVSVAHVERMLRLLLPWCMPAAGAVAAALEGDETQLLDGCRGLAALCAGHKADVLDAASTALLQSQAAPGGGAPGAPPALPGLFEALEQLTAACLAAGGISPSSCTEPWLFDATEMLLECWSGLLTPQCGYYALEPVPPPAAAAAAATRTAAAVVDAALRDAAAGAREDADDDADAGAGACQQEEWMARVAVLLRAAPVASFSGLADALEATQRSLSATVAAGGDGAEALEQLHWLVRMAAHALADCGAGEVALPPEAVLLACSDSSGAGAVERLSRSLLQLIALCLQPGGAAAASPRLLEGCVWAAGRWADTYLFPEDDQPLPQPLQTAFGGQSGDAVLDMLVHVAQHCLAAHPGEAELHRQVCQSLLPVLVHRRPLCRRLLVLPSWQQLAHAFARRDAALAEGLGGKLQRALCRSLVLAAAGFDAPADAQSYVSQLLSAAVEQVRSLAAQPAAQLAAAGQRADVQLQLCALLEVLRGAVGGATPSSCPALLAALAPLLAPLLLLHDAFKRVPPVVALLLKLADDLVEGLGLYLEEPGPRQELLAWALQLLLQYRDSNLWQVSLQTARTLREDRAAEQCRDLRAVLSLLLHITQGDLGGDGEEADAAAAGAPQCLPGDTGSTVQHTAVPGTASTAASSSPSSFSSSSPLARAVLVGLSIVLPLLNEELLKYPKLSALYYSLLAHMLEAHPAAVAELPSGEFGRLMATLEWGAAGSDALAARCSLEGLAGLALFQLRAAALGKQGLAVHSAGGRSVVAHFQELLLRRLLLDDAAPDTVELAADALLPLLLAEPAAFGPLASSITAAASASGEQRAATAVSGALSRLGSWLQGHADAVAAVGGPVAGGSAMRTAMRQFRQQLSQVVADVRGLIRLR